MLYIVNGTKYTTLFVKVPGGNELIKLRSFKSSKSPPVVTTPTKQGSSGIVNPEALDCCGVKDTVGGQE
jgi:hypothetical protein